VLTALKSDNCTQHCEPQEQDPGKFIRPDDRLLEEIARRNAGEQHDDFRDNEQRGDCSDG